MKRVIPYALVVAAAVAGSAYFSDQAVEGFAEVAYENQIEGCERGNETLREPLNHFFTVFARDETNETDDPKVAEAASELRDETEPIDCQKVIEAP